MGKVSSSNSQGVRVPKLRFPEFDETWKEFRLSDVSCYQTGKDNVPKNKYVSTENMLQNFSGIEPYKDETIVSGIPFAMGDVLIANIRPYLKKVWKANFDGCCSTDVLVLHSTDINSDYLYYNIARESFITHVMSGVKGSKMPRGDKAQILEYKVGVPTHKEQQKIASVLSLLDNRIAKQRQLVEALKSYKRGALSKLFPQKGKATPEYRFAGFTEPWERRKVGELTEDYIEKTVIQNQFPVLTSSQQQGIVFQEEYFADRQVTTNNNIGYYVLPKGYFTYRSRSDTDVFIFNRNNLIDKGIISYYYPVFRAKNTDPDFLLRRLNYGIRSQLSKAAEGTGQKVLAHSKFKQMIVDVPSFSEQERIGKFFATIDHLITLHQHRLSEYQIIKEGLLQQLFV